MSRSTLPAGAEKPNPFGVTLKPVGKTLTLDRGANAVITTSKDKGASEVVKLKSVYGKDGASSEKKISPRSQKEVTKPLGSTASGSSVKKMSPRSKTPPKDNEIKIGGFKLSLETSTSKDKSKPDVRNGSTTSDNSSNFSRTPFYRSLNSGKNPASAYDPVTGEVMLDKAKTEKFMSQTKTDPKSGDPPWKVQLKSVGKTTTSKPEDSVVVAKSANSSISKFSVSVKDNSRRSNSNRASTAPVKKDSTVSKVTKVKAEDKTAQPTKSSGSKILSGHKKATAPNVPGVKKGTKQNGVVNGTGTKGDGKTRDDNTSVKSKHSSTKSTTSDSVAKVSPRGAFVQRLIETCETRDERQDSKLSSSASVEFPDKLLDNLAILEGLVNEISSDESGDSDDDGGYSDVAAVIECLAEEGILDVTKEFGTLRGAKHAKVYGRNSDESEGSDSEHEYRNLSDGFSGSSTKNTKGKVVIMHGAKTPKYENLHGSSKKVDDVYDWVELGDKEPSSQDVNANYELAGPVDWSKKGAGLGEKKRRFAFKNVKLKKTKKDATDSPSRKSAPPLLSHKPQQKEEDNVYNVPEDSGVHIPDWDTGSSRVSMAESESTSSDSVTNPVNVLPHTVIELTDKQARKLKKRQTDNTESSAKWKDKWKQFYRRSQDLLDIPGLQTKLENLSLTQLPANVKQKLREKIKKKKSKRKGRLEINPLDEDDEFTDEFAASSSEDLRSDAGESIYQDIDSVREEKIQIVNVNLRVSASPEKIPISPPTAGGDGVDSAPNLPPRFNTGSLSEKYSELGPRAKQDSPPALPPTLPPKLSELTPPTKPKLNTKRASLPGMQLIHGELGTAPPLPPRNGRMSLGNLDIRVPPQSTTRSLGESYLKQPKLADKFPSEGSPKKSSVKRDSLLLGQVPPPLQKPSRQDSSVTDSGSVASGSPLPLGYLDMNQSDGQDSKESSPSRTLGSGKSVRAPFEDVMAFRRKHVDRRPDSTQVDIDLELDVSVSRSRYKSRFEREPLYQYYNKDYIKRQSWQRALSEEPSSPGAESVTSVKSTQECISPEVTITISVENSKSGLPSLPEAESQNQPSPLLSTLSKSGTVQRSLWSEVPEVLSSGVAESLSADEKKEQEAMFEIITSEASYFKSLNVLINTFAMSPELCGDISEKAVITKHNKHLLFSNIGAVRDASEKFLADLEARWNENVLISDISDIIIKHATENFDCYIKYCSNKTYQDRIYTDLLKTNPGFKEAVIRLQSLSEVQGLPMASFFMLPMQRITRLPLLMDGVCRHRDNEHKNYALAIQAQDALNKLVKKCNEGAKIMEQTEQLCMIEKQLDFKIKKVPIVSASRHLVKEGELTRIVTDSNSKLPFGKNRPGKQSLYLFLLNDLLLVTKRKGESLFSVIDCTKRNSVYCELVQNPDNFPLLPNGAPSGCKNVFLMVMLENHEGKQVELILSCNSPSDRARWMEAVTPKTQVSENERVYEEWDCPQVQAVHSYIATQPDELDLEEADVVNVFRKMADGWYEGERIRDGERGWFPQSYVEEILSSHVRARNLRLRYRLLVASKEFADGKKS